MKPGIAEQRRARCCCSISKTLSYRFRILNPALSVEFVEFVEKVRWPEMNFP